MSDTDTKSEIVTETVLEVALKKATLQGRAKTKGNHTNYEKVPKKPDGVRRDILGNPLTTFAHVDSGEFCLGQHIYGQCIYCKNCHDYIRPANIRKPCLGWQEAKVRTESSCQKCADRKFNKEIADIKLWAVPGLSVNETLLEEVTFLEDKVKRPSCEPSYVLHLEEEKLQNCNKWLYNHKTKELIDTEEDVSY